MYNTHIAMIKTRQNTPPIREQTNILITFIFRGKNKKVKKGQLVGYLIRGFNKIAVTTALEDLPCSELVEDILPSLPNAIYVSRPFTCVVFLFSRSVLLANVTSLSHTAVYIQQSLTK